jgi:hypothetical protein
LTELQVDKALALTYLRFNLSAIPADATVVSTRFRMIAVSGAVYAEADQSVTRVVTWALNRSPSRMVVDVVKQDEFTQDVVLPYEGDVIMGHACTHFGNCPSEYLVTCG